MVESNCVGYVLYSLGILSHERYVSPLQKNFILSKFDTSNTSNNSDAVAILKDKFSGRILHMGILDETQPGIVAHRPGAGLDVIREDLQKVLSYYFNMKTRIIFLRLNH